MALYSLESVHSPQRVAGNPVAVDTSYLIALSNPRHLFFNSVNTFHAQAQANGTEFVISVVVRQEFIKMVRKSLFADAMNNLASSDNAIYLRYQSILRQTPTSARLADNCEKIVKDHVRRGDTSVILNAVNTDIWQEVQRLEAQAGMYYMSGTWASSWDDLGMLMQATGIAAPDGMIANMALSLALDAIVTTDCDYACISSIVDVYMPLTVALSCKAYDATND
ncbi:MAG: hypothetical protein JWL77_3597 [Chthonomonadaceae bacterium]|nr:hypothetical protein [Chthonomonadaceae bacterium]